MSEPPGPPRRIGPAGGWHWFTGALAIVRRWPTTFILMGLIAAAIYTLVPLFGRLVMLVIGPALLAGITAAAHTASTGQPPVVQQLFSMFQRPEQRREALKLCVPLVVANIVAVLILAFAVANLMASQHVDLAALQGHPEKLMTLMRKELRSPPMRVWWGVAFALVLFAWTFTALAIPRVALSARTAYSAMAASLRAVWGHLGAWIAAALALFVCIAIVGAILALTRLAILVELGALTTMYTLAGPLLYLAWRDFGGTVAAPDGQQPPAPPPPSGVLEA